MDQIADPIMNFYEFDILVLTVLLIFFYIKANSSYPNATCKHLLGASLRV